MATSEPHCSLVSAYPRQPPLQKLLHVYVTKTGAPCCPRWPQGVVAGLSGSGHPTSSSPPQNHQHVNYNWHQNHTAAVQNRHWEQKVPARDHTPPPSALNTRLLTTTVEQTKPWVCADGNRMDKSQWGYSAVALPRHLLLVLFVHMHADSAHSSPPTHHVSTHARLTMDPGRPAHTQALPAVQQDMGIWLYVQLYRSARLLSTPPQQCG